MLGEETSETGNWYSDETATFGDRLAAAREAMGLSQQDLSGQIGVKLKTIVDWDNDLNDPRANRLQMLSGVLNVSIPWLLTGEGEGLGSPQSKTPDEVEEILGDMRRARTQISDLTQTLAALDIRLRASLRS